MLHDFRPDLTFILDVPVETGIARTQGRDHAENRFEKKGLEFQERLRQAFLAIARRDPMRCVVIDASQDEETVAKAIWKTVAERYKLK